MAARRRVLIVEPDPAAREATLGYLSNGGFDVFAVADEESAILAVTAFRPTAIVIDPVVSRYARMFAEVLRQIAGHDVRIIATAAARVHEAWHGVFDLALQKPFPLEDLQNILATWSMGHAA